MTKVILFDLDDTLISELDYIRSGYQHIATVLSNRIQATQAEIYQQLWSLFEQSPQQVFNRLLDAYQVCYTIEDVLALVKEYREHSPNINFFDDVIPTLDKLREKGVRLGIITDGYAVAQRKKLETVEANQYFEKIIVTDELGKEFWKPHPKAFEMMQQYFEVEFSEMVYVGDNPLKDFYIGSIYPIQTVRVVRSQSVYNGKEYQDEIIPDKVIDELSTLAYDV